MTYQTDQTDQSDQTDHTDQTALIDQTAKPTMRKRLLATTAATPTDVGRSMLRPYPFCNPALVVSPVIPRGFLPCHSERSSLFEQGCGAFPHPSYPLSF